MNRVCQHELAITKQMAPLVRFLVLYSLSIEEPFISRSILDSSMRMSAFPLARFEHVVHFHLFFCKAQHGYVRGREELGNLVGFTEAAL